MPSAIRKGDELHERAVASNQDMCRHLQIGDGGKAVVSARVQAIAKKLFDMRATVFAGWQADSVHHDQVDTAVGRSSIEVRRQDATGIVEPVTRRIELQHSTSSCPMRMDGAITFKFPASSVLGSQTLPDPAGNRPTLLEL